MRTKVASLVPNVPAARRTPAAGRHAHKKARLVFQEYSSVAVSAIQAADERRARKVEIAGRNSEGWRSDNKEAVLQGSLRSGDGEEAALEENKQWHATAFPSYLQSEKDDFCQSWEETLQDVERRQSLLTGNSSSKAVTASNPVWQAMRKEAGRDAAKEPLLSSFMYASILSHDSFLECLASVLANRLEDQTMRATEYFDTFNTVFNENAEIVQAALDDIQAVCERDPACGSYSNALLFYKGYQAIQVHRVAHHLWNLDQKIAARNLQYRVSQVFAMDIHPQAKFGKGILMDHGTGIVVGQTAVVGNNVSILQNVTLGGTGKSDGDRHPKINDNVLIGAGATVLGNIIVGKGAMVASGSLVLKPVPSKTMVAGSPAREVGKLTGNPALKMQHWLRTINPESDPFCEPFEDMLRDRAQQQSERSPELRARAPEAVEQSLSAHAENPSSSHVLRSDPSGSPIEPSSPHEGRPQERNPGEEELPPTASHKITEQHANGHHVAGAGYFDNSVLLKEPGPEQGNSSNDGRAARQRDAAPPSSAKEHGAEVGVRSDIKARKLWPEGPEPEYYL